jgi:hypothetical protein
MNEEMNSVLKKQGIINGVLLGILFAALSIFNFYYLTVMVTSPILIVVGYHTFFPIILPLAIAVYFILKLRAKVGGYWNFKQAVRGIFIILLAAYFTQFIVKDMLFVKLVEPNMLYKSEHALLNASKADFKRRNVSQKDIDQKITEIESNLVGKKQITIGEQIQAIGITIIFLFVLALMFAGFFKRELLYYTPHKDDRPIV